MKWLRKVFNLAKRKIVGRQSRDYALEWGGGGRKKCGWWWAG